MPRTIVPGRVKLDIYKPENDPATPKNPETSNADAKRRAKRTVCRPSHTDHGYSFAGHLAIDLYSTSLPE